MVEHRRTLAVLTLFVLMLSLSSACSGSDDEAADPTRETETETRIGNAVVRIDAAGRVREVIPVPWGLEIRVTSGYVWVHHRSDGKLTQIDPRTRRARAVAHGEVAGIAAANRDLWIAVDGNRIARIDGATGLSSRRFEWPGGSSSSLGTRASSRLSGIPSG